MFRPCPVRFNRPGPWLSPMTLRFQSLAGRCPTIRKSFWIGQSAMTAFCRRQGMVDPAVLVNYLLDQQLLQQCDLPDITHTGRILRVYSSAATAAQRSTSALGKNTATGEHDSGQQSAAANLAGRRSGRTGNGGRSGRAQSWRVIPKPGLRLWCQTWMREKPSLNIS